MELFIFIIVITAIIGGVGQSMYQSKLKASLKEKEIELEKEKVVLEQIRLELEVKKLEEPN
ncbi:MULTISPECIES: hypothetical protein [Bacillus]|uniref:hypothetical protein n=1 Tax=Bacillus TaxID=1386 RepID=UPI000BB9940A|nr:MULTISPECIES: hypothetical protein [Bacillus]